jgi:hypothetical protein
VLAAAGLVVPLAGGFLTTQAAGATTFRTGYLKTAATTSSSSTTTPPCIVKAKPGSEVEAGLGVDQHSSIAFVIEVECQPVYSEDYVQLFSAQLNNACHDTLTWYSPTADAGSYEWGYGETFDVFLDDDGNATAVVWGGPSCAASYDLLTADLESPPFYTARTHLTIKPPQDTAPGIYSYPNSEVEDSISSSVAVVFYVEFPSVYSEQTVEIADPQLYDRCSGGIQWFGSEPNSAWPLSTGKSVDVTLDNNGNAFVVALAGPSCASGRTLASADLTVAPYTTYTRDFTVLSPRVTV